MSNIEKYFRRYLSIAPLGLALWRTVEVKHLGKVKLSKPILDIGCGFGEFAQAYADAPIDMGLDLCSRDLYIASKTRKYKNLILADARDMPFSDNSYQSIFSISTFEHITNPKKLLLETYRVLKIDGILFLTLETDKVDSATFYRPFLDKHKLSRISKLLSNSYNRIFHRQTLLTKEKWIELIEEAGFTIIKKQDIISTQITKLFDILLILSWPSQIFKIIFGKRMAFRPQFVTNLFVKIFLPLIEHEETEGTNLLIIAKKIKPKR